MPDFIPGLRLGELFYREAVKPVLDAEFPDLLYSAALIGSGSEILGFDTEMSSDHHWGPRIMLFLGDDDYERYKDSIDEMMRHKLPHTVHGYPTNFGDPDPDDNGVQLLQATNSGPVNHRVELFTLRGFFEDYIGYDIDSEIGAADWLTFPEQLLRTITEGAVYHDGSRLQVVRDRFAYYPHDVWLYLLTAGWARIGQEEHLMPRAGYTDDEIGSGLIGSRLVRDLMRLCFLMEKVYAPYSKWFGAAFARLKCAGELAPILRRVLLAESWQEREKHLSVAYEYVAEMHNALGITEKLPAQVSSFHGRPFMVIQGDVFVEALRAKISDPEVKRITSKTFIGSVDQFSDSTDVLSDRRIFRKLRELY